MAALSIGDENELLTALHDGLFEVPYFDTFLARLRARIQADVAAFSVLSTARPTVTVSPVALTPDLSSFGTRLSVGDEATITNAMRPGRLYARRELLDPGRDLYEPDTEAWLDQMGLNDMRLIRIVTEEGVGALVMVARRRGSFNSADGAVLIGLAPHIQRALRTHSRLGQLEHDRAMDERLLARLDIGWISVDREGQITGASDEGHRLMRRERPLRSGASGRLFATEPGEERQFAEHFTAAVASGEPEAMALTADREAIRQLLILPPEPSTSETDVDDVDGIGSRTRPDVPIARPSSVLICLKAKPTPHDRHAAIAQLFDLLPSEARLALALCEGRSLAQAARHLNITIETARNYSKKIYAKTGAQGQGDLVRQILSSIVPVA